MLTTETIKRGEEGFWNTFDSQPVSPHCQQELYAYVILGLRPGSFHSALFSNDLMEAAHRTHRLNSWTAIVAIMKWVAYVAPVESYGSREKVEAWLALSGLERRKICEKKKFVLTEEQLTWEILKEE